MSDRWPPYPKNGRLPIFFPCPRISPRPGNSFSRVRPLGNGLEILRAVSGGKKSGWKLSLRCPSEKNQAGKSLWGVRQKKIGLENLFEVSGGISGHWKISFLGTFLAAPTCFSVSYNGFRRRVRAGTVKAPPPRPRRRVRRPPPASRGWDGASSGCGGSRQVGNPRSPPDPRGTKRRRRGAARPPSSTGCRWRARRGRKTTSEPRTFYGELLACSRSDVIQITATS